MMRWLAGVVLGLASLATLAIASEPLAIVETAQSDAMLLIGDATIAAVVTDPADDTAVQRAAENLRGDLAKVAMAQLPRDAAVPIIVGTIGNSKQIDALVAAGKLDVADVKGKWEGYVQQVVDAPMPGVDRALVIAGADRRGTIFGVYDLSARIGVSPWHYWADVPVQQRKRLYATAGRRADAPKVRYRGIFINDEEPALGNWARSTFGGINAKFYERVFDLLLRSRANYVWPAMWGKSLWEDDPESARLANEMGVNLGTSHHEPMMRAHVDWQRASGGKWNYETNPLVLKQFWRDGIDRTNGQDRLVTVGMRGDGDEPMSETTAIALLEKIVADQRSIIADSTKKPAEKTPQMWALYKEVQDYYDQGMQVPDDILLLFADDNWGNIRRLPKLGTTRAGGYGVYYHFDYVGDPRNYKWLNNTQIERVWEQMRSARAHGADALWIANVGDIKPMELPTSFFLDLAWNPESIPLEKVQSYYRDYAARQFGGAQADDIASLLRDSSRVLARRKPELIDANYYRTNDDNEAERIAAEYAALDARARGIAASLPADQQSAFYQLVHHPIEAMTNLHSMYRAIAEGRTDDARAAFAHGAAIRQRYESLESGKWKYMMSQTHISYTGWQQPEVDVMPDAVSWRPEAVKRNGPTAKAIKGERRFLESSGLIVIDAPDFMRTQAAADTSWKAIENLGHWKGAVALLSQDGLPQTGATFDAGAGPVIEYDVALGVSGKFSIAVYASPSLDVLDRGGLRYAVSVDDGPIITGDLMKGEANEWSKAVADNIRIALTGHEVKKGGRHTIRIWGVDPGVIIQRVVVTRGALPRSKLGPESLKPQ
jgi:Glycosyl hydrolase family 115/Gylcosyl hydrolase family 115 C-terminal domain